MEALILDNELKSIYLIDDFESLIWNDSYIGCGDFEIYAPINDRTLDIATFIRNQRNKELDTYVWRKESEQVMIVELVEMSTEVESGPRLRFTGRSLESILERRIIWRQTELNGDFQNGIERLLNENVINPSLPERKIPNFIFERSTDPKITSLTLSKQFTGDNLYEAIQTVCEPIDLGFRIRLTDQNKFAFGLYYGTDRSYDQLNVPYVIFSPKFENLISSSLLEDVKEFCTVTLVAGEDEGTERRTVTVGHGSGLSRRELFTDARDIQSESYNDDGELVKVPDDQYFGYLTQRGVERLSEHKFIRDFEGEVEATNLFKYREDFYKGDIVQVATDYGVMAKMRVMQMVWSQDTSGSNSYPVFKILE